jgi:hypothetical protein
MIAAKVSKEEAVRLVLAELGDASAAEVVALVERRFGLKVAPAFIPVYKASLRAEQWLVESRAAAHARLAASRQEAAAGGKEPSPPCPPADNP